MRLILLLAVAGTLEAQSWVPVTAGALQCGVIKRAADQVQVYCYGPGLPLKLFFNSIETIGPDGLALTYNYHYDGFVFLFEVNGNEIDYTLSINDLVDGKPVTHPQPPGKLTQIYGTVGFLRNGVCKPFGTGFHEQAGILLANEPTGCRL